MFVHFKKSTTASSKDLILNENNQYPFSEGTIYFSKDNFLLYDYVLEENNQRIGYRDFINAKSSQYIVDQDNNYLNLGRDSRPIYLEDGFFKESSQDLYFLLRGSDEDVILDQPLFLAEADKLSSLHGNAGNIKHPVFFENGIPKSCDNTLNISISGMAEKALKDDANRIISSSYVLKEGDIISGQVTINKNIEKILIIQKNNTDNLYINESNINSSNDLYLNKTSGKKVIIGNIDDENGLEVFGNISITKDPVDEMNVATKKYVDSKTSSIERIFYKCESSSGIIPNPISKENLNIDKLLIFYNGLLLEEGINFLYDSDNNIVLLDFLSQVNDQFIFIQIV